MKFFETQEGQRMKRYFFSAVTSDGENANVFIDAENPQSAITRYILGQQTCWEPFKLRFNCGSCPR